jgi:hypothetical protein
LRTALTTQPQARLDHHGPRHPHEAALFLETELIGLPLSQGPWWFDQGLGHSLPLAPGAGLPSGDRPLVESKGGHNGLQRAAMGQQRHHNDDDLCRSAQAGEDRPFGCRESPTALATEESLVRARMEANIALTSLASGRARQMRAEYGCGVHDDPPGFVWKQATRSMSGPPLFSQANRTTV